MTENLPHICILGDESSIHIKRWVLGLRNLGFKIDLITFRKSRDHDLGAISLNASSKLSYLTKIKALEKAVLKIKPQIIHAHYASSYGLLLSYIDHPMKVLSVWGDDIVVFPNKNPLFSYFVRRSIDNANVITATSLFLKRTVDTLRKVHPPIVVIPFGVDLNHFRFRQRSEQRKITIGIAKALKPKYGIDYLLKAVKLLLDYGIECELRIAGRGDFEEAYKKLAIDLGLGQRVTFVGFLNHGQLLDFLNELDIFAMPSISHGESFGVAAIEAGATGLPVVATRVGGVPEVIKDEKTGILVEPRQIDSLFQALLKLSSNYELRHSMGKAARKFIEENYDWENNLNAMAQLYKDLAN